LASVDYEGDISRIIAILKNDSGLFPVVSIGDEKLREIYFGEDSAKIHYQSHPHALVTTSDRPFQTKDTFGIGDGSSDPQHTVQYLIRVFAKKGRPQVAEKFLYRFIKKTVDILKANPRLKEPVGRTDPKCVRSFVDIPRLGEHGEEIQSTEIILICQIGSQTTATLTGGLVLNLLSFNAPEGFNFDENLTDEQLRCVDASSDKGTWLLEYENTSTNEYVILALLGTVGKYYIDKKWRR